MTLTKFYLAARYSRREELCGYRQLLHDMGHLVTSRWLTGSHEIKLDPQGLSLQSKHEHRERFAHEDMTDVLSADCLLAFTEEPRSGNSRGGRHVEMGIAMGSHKSVNVIGPLENVFCCHPSIVAFPSFNNFMEYLKTRG